MSRRLQQIHVQAREGGKGLNQKQRLKYLVSVNTLLYWQSVSENNEIVLNLEGTQPDSESFNAIWNLSTKPGELDF